jgi:(E)-4-hydroxy-3-methylbut-2-enyl-diphosphate synthase
MITCDTMDTEASIAQTIELAEVGCEIVRITAPTVKDARNLELIVKGLRARGCEVPIVADIHFKPDAAMEAAKWVDKVRINPGNYADSKKFAVREYTDDQYAAELARIRERFSPLVELCKERGIAMRIGTNHGSLSDRILNRYGDTPLGMVESALEFARIARDLDYHALIFSMKSSNPKVMIAAYRLLVSRLDEEEVAQVSNLRSKNDGKLETCPTWNYPVHLGVTEAGEGEDARIKSAIGIGALLEDGIGDTVRVSLTEDSVHEIPVAKELVKKYNAMKPGSPPVIQVTERRSPYSYLRREVSEQHIGALRLRVGKEHPPRVEVPVPVTATPVAALGPLPPMYEPKSTSEPLALSFNRNPLLSKLWPGPGAWLYGTPPGLTGRFVACVSPATYAFPPLSTATLFPNVVKLPPRKVEYTSAVPVLLSFVRNPSRVELVVR